MKRQPPNARKQSGIALIALLVLLILAGSYAFYRSANVGFGGKERDATLLVNLAKAKESLIAYAVMDSKRPGRLLCPDLLGDGVSPLLSRDDCDAYTGWLPWKTLDLKEATDDHGTKLRYVALRWFGGDRANPPLNSDTLSVSQLAVASISKSSLDSISLGTLYLDTLVGTGTDAINPTIDPKNDIVALIIAPRGELDARNADGDNYFFSGKSSSDPDNDVIMPVTRQELMAAVEKRVAGEVKSCLEQHAASVANTAHAYPWPAPFSATGFQGMANSLFGRVPATQPTAGPEAALKDNITKLNQTLSELSSPSSDANAQMSALNALNDTIFQARSLFDSIFLVANKLKQTSDEVVNQLAGITTAVNSAAANGRISRSEGTNIRTLAGGTDANLDNLTDQLTELGIDVFPWELGQLTSTLSLATGPADYINTTQFIRDLLLITTTNRSDILPSLVAAQNAARFACHTTGNPQLDCDAMTAQAAATTLIGTLSTLTNSVEASRVSIRAGDVSPYTTSLTSLSTILRNSPSVDNAKALWTALISIKASVDGITTGVSAVTTAKMGASIALQTVIDNASATSPDYALIDSSTAIAVDAISALTTAIAVNEQVDNNVSHTSLNAAIAAYKNARVEFIQRDTASPRPRQNTITPYAAALGNTAVNIEIWANIVANNADRVAPLAKANPVAAAIDPSKADTLTTSAYQAAGDALGSITGKNESAALLQAYIDSPTLANQNQAITALGETVTLANSLLNAATTLDNQLSGTTASAFPIVWLSNRCDFLQPTNTTSWWTSNQWANTIFYQISSATTIEPGKLTVNGTGNYRVVAIAAGRAMSGKSHAIPTVDNFLEGINADSTRNGNAYQPLSPNFTSAPPSNTFNDRIAY